MGVFVTYRCMLASFHVYWDRLPEWNEEELGKRVRKAKTGDEDEVWNLACALKYGKGVRKVWPLAKDLFQWMVEQGYETEEAEVMNLNHLLDPSLPYTVAEIKKF